MIKFQYQTFFTSQDIKQFVFKFRFTQISKTFGFIIIQFYQQWTTWEKREEEVGVNISISREWTELLRWNKKHKPNIRWYQVFSNSDGMQETIFMESKLAGDIRSCMRINIVIQKMFAFCDLCGRHFCKNGLDLSKSFMFVYI